MEYRPPLPPERAFQGDNPVEISPRLELPNPSTARDVVLAAGKGVPIISGIVEHFAEKARDEARRKTVILLNLCIERLEQVESDISHIKGRITSDGFVALFRRAADEISRTVDEERLLYLRNALLNIDSSEVPGAQKDILMEVICGLSALHIRALYVFWKQGELIAGIDEARIDEAAEHFKNDQDFDRRRVALGLALADANVPSEHASYIVARLESFGLLVPLLDMDCKVRNGFILPPLPPVTDMGAMVLDRVLRQ